MPMLSIENGKQITMDVYINNSMQNKLEQSQKTSRSMIVMCSFFLYYITMELEDTAMLD